MYIDDIYKQYGSRVKEVSMEITVPTNLKTYLSDMTLLLEKTVVGMYFWDGADVSPNTGATLVSKSGQENSFITLVSGSDTILDGAPLAAFSLSDTDKNYKPLYLDSFTPSKSFILAAAGQVTATNVYYLTWIYLD